MERKMFSSDSIFFRLATVYGPMSSVYPRADICSYIRAVIGGCIMAIVVSLLISVTFIITLVDPLAWAVYNLLNDVYVPLSFLGWVSFIFDVILIIFGSLFALKHYYGRQIAKFFFKEEAVRGTYKPNFIVEAYRSIHDNTCFPIQFDGISENDD